MGAGALFVVATHAVVESADGTVGQNRSHVAYVLAAARGALELGEESDVITEQGIFVVLSGILEGIVSDAR